MPRHRSAAVAVAITLGLVCFANAQPRPQTSALINEALDRPIKLELNNTLPQAIQIIENETGVPIRVQPAVWDLLPWGQQTNITAKIENQTLRQSLEAIAGKLGLTYVLRDEALELRPVPALQRLGRRSTPEELAALDLLSTTQLGLRTDRPMVREVIEGVDQKLVDAKAPFAIENRAGEVIKADQAIFVARNATLSDALETLTNYTPATWYPWGKSVVITSKEDQIRSQLGKTISIRYNGVDVAQVLTELSQRAGVPFDIQPGAIQQIPAEFRNIRLILDNVSIRQALESLAGFTGLGYTVNDKGVYLWNQAATPQAGRDPIVGLFMIPDLGIQAVVTESQVPPDVREYLQYKTQREVEKLRQMMTEEGFRPTTRPAPAEDL